MKTHQMSRTKFYRAWSNMMSRCNTPTTTYYKNYGGRGIKVCKRWSKFENFYKDMHGTYQEHLTLDRIDVNGNYTPKNCKWSTPKEQSNNQRKSIKIVIDNETVTIEELSEMLNISKKTLWTRLKRGNKDIKELCRPVGRNYNKTLTDVDKKKSTKPTGQLK